jgi:nitroreductase
VIFQARNVNPLRHRAGRAGTLDGMPELHPLLAGRWSPRGFDDRYELRDAELASLLEAARWAPSGQNAQPWRFVVGHRDDPTHKRIFAALTDADQAWAGRASALVAAGFTAGADPYDLGQAVAHLGVQAVALGLHTRQVLEFDAAGLHRDLELPADVTVHAVVAAGRLGDPDTLPPDLRRREFRLRTRRRVSELLLPTSA